MAGGALPIVMNILSTVMSRKKKQPAAQSQNGGPAVDMQKHRANLTEGAILFNGNYVPVRKRWSVG